MTTLASNQANVQPKGLVEENWGKIRCEGEETVKESLDSKLLTFILGLTSAHREWLQELKSVDWDAVDPKTATWQLFASAKLHGIRHSVAYPLVKRIIEEHGVEITSKELSNRAHGAYNSATPQETPQGDRPPVPKPNIYSGMVIPKASIDRG